MGPQEASLLRLAARLRRATKINFEVKWVKPIVNLSIHGPAGEASLAVERKPAKLRYQVE